MTAGGPLGSSEVLAYKMYQEALFNFRMGYGAAIATIFYNHGYLHCLVFISFI